MPVASFCLKERKEMKYSVVRTWITQGEINTLKVECSTMEGSNVEASCHSLSDSVYWDP